MQANKRNAIMIKQQQCKICKHTAHKIQIMQRSFVYKSIKLKNEQKKTSTESYAAIKNLCKRQCRVIDFGFFAVIVCIVLHLLLLLMSLGFCL